MRKARRRKSFFFFFFDAGSCIKPHSKTHYSIYLYLSCSTKTASWDAWSLWQLPVGEEHISNSVLLFYLPLVHTLSLTTSLPLALSSLLCFHIYNYSHSFCAFLCLLHTLISLPAPTTLSTCAIWLPLLSAFLCRLLFCLSEAGLLVPYRTFMNYERRLSSWEGNGSLSVQPLC